MTKTETATSAPWLKSVPPDWQVDRLKDIVPRIVGGGTPDSGNPDYWDNGDVVWVTPTDFSKTADAVEIFDSEKKITQLGLNESAATLLPVGAVIMASRATIGTVRLAGVPLSTNQGFISFVCDEFRLHNRFLYYVIRGYLGDYFAQVAPGTTFNEISRGAAKVEPIAFPKIDEQRRIATFLDARCAAIARIVSLTKGQEDNNGSKGLLNQQMDVLLAYQQAVIHECVTGLRRVTEKELSHSFAYA